MKALPVLLFALLGINAAVAQKVYSTTAGGQITWGSASHLGPNWGFYGQEIELSGDADVLSVSVYLYDHQDHDETKSTLNFAVWQCDGKPTSEIYRSEAQTIQKDEVGAWLKHKFAAPLSLKGGTYLFAVGQSTVQGFVAFGGQTRKAGYTGKEWMKLPLPDISDGKKWMTIRDMVLAMGGTETAGLPDITALENNVLMMQVEFAE